MRRSRSQCPRPTLKCDPDEVVANSLKLLLIQSGRPAQSAYIESFSGKFRDECLNENWFISLEHAKATISAWRRDCNEVRPHS